MAVVEMGANHRGEIASYCLYTLPNYGLITNVGKAHLEGFGGPEGVKKGKGELFDFLRETSGTAFIMWDYDYLREMSAGLTEVIRYGEGSIIESSPFLKVGVDNMVIQSHLVGAYNFPNLLAALAVGRYFGVDPIDMKKALENYHPSNSRSQLLEKKGSKIVLDAYNANPSSMKAAIENFSKIDSDNKILILGAMAELGEESLNEHQEILNLINNYHWKDVVLVGGDFLKIQSHFKTFKNAEEAAKWYKQQQFENAYLLVKGSRSTQMEKVIAD
jgi:UDP-N-acetylmuramoyl-tripeptide--D-alanyl-D-alanine ligase